MVITTSSALRATLSSVRVRALVANPHDGLASVDSTLDALDAGIDADGLFLDWAIANILNDPGVDQGQYAYGNIPGLATPRPARV